MEIVDKKIARLKVKGRWRECLLYSVIISGELYTGGMMTIDKKWFCSCAKPSSVFNQWTKVKYYPQTKSYGFPDPHDHGRENPYVICEQIIDAIDHYLIERLVLS